MQRLILNDIEVPLGGDLIALTLSADDLEDATTLNSSYSNTFEIPLTAQLREALNNSQAGTADGTEYTNIPARYETDYLVISGFANIVSYSAESVSIVLFEGVIDFLEELGDLNLQQIDKDEYGTAVARTTANVKAGLQNDYTDGYTYAIADYGTGPGNTIRTEETTPFPFFHKIVEVIAGQTSYTLITGTGLLADSFFRKCAVAWDGGRYNEDSYFHSNFDGFTITAGTAGPGVYVVIGATNILLNNGKFDGTGYLCTADERRSIIFTAGANIDITTDPASGGSYEYNIRFIIQAAGGGTKGVLAQYSSGAVTGVGGSASVSFELAAGPTNPNDFEEGDRVVIAIDAVTGLLFDTQQSYFRNDDGRDDITPSKTPTYINPYANPPSSITDEPLFVLPDMLCREFLKGVAQMFGARYKVDTVAKTVEVIYFEEYSASGAEDWSDKISFDRDYKNEFKYGSYANTNYLSYTNDDTVGETYGRGTISITNAQLEPEYEMLALPFGASLQSPTTATSIYIPALTVASGGLIAYGSGYTEESLNPRVCYIENSTRTATIDDNSTTDTQANANEARFFVVDDSQHLLFSEAGGLVANYYGAFSTMVQAMQLVTVRILLNADDLGKLNFFAPKFVNFANGVTRFGGLFLLQEITEYTGNGPAKCELVNLNRI